MVSPGPSSNEGRWRPLQEGRALPCSHTELGAEPTSAARLWPWHRGTSGDAEGDPVRVEVGGGGTGEPEPWLHLLVPLSHIFLAGVGASLTALGLVGAGPFLLITPDDLASMPGPSEIQGESWTRP